MMNTTIRRIASVTAAAAATFVFAGWTHAAQASTMHRVYVLRYVDHTTFCKRSQAGADGLVVGDGKPFEVVCEKFGTPYRNLPQRFAWDEERWTS